VNELPIRDNLIVRTSLARPVTMLMMLLSAVVLGIVALVNIPLELIPSGFSRAVYAGRGAVLERDGAGRGGADHAAAGAGAVDDARAR
jgi:hypothetical protein